MNFNSIVTTSSFTNTFWFDMAKLLKLSYDFSLDLVSTLLEPIQIGKLNF